jgi:HAE1 family hydrophobic/amphiphilic exporter-1
MTKSLKLKALLMPLVATTLTSQTAVQRALDKNSAIAQQRAQLAVREAELSQSWSAVLPSIDGNLKAGTRKDASSSRSALFGGNSYNFYTTEITATQAILKGGGLWGEVARASVEKEIRRNEVKVAERDLAANVVRAFLATMLADTSFKTLTKQEIVQSDTLRTAMARFRVGNERELGVLQLQTTLALLKPRIISAKEQLSTQMIDLALLLGEDQGGTLLLQGSLEPPEWDAIAKELKASQEVQRLEVENAKLMIEEHEQMRLVKMAPYWPSLAAFATIGRDGTAQKEILDGDATRWQMGLQLTIPLFRGLGSFDERKALANEGAKRRIAQKGTIDQVSAELVKADIRIRDAKTSLDASFSALELARRAVPLAQKNYSLGIATYNQLADTQQNLLDAELSVEKSRHDYLNRMLEYFIAAGWPIDEFVKRVNPNSARGSG